VWGLRSFVVCGGGGAGERYSIGLQWRRFDVRAVREQGKERD
jgi:hypothetical protein